MSAGTGKSRRGSPSVARRMNSAQIGAAARPPVIPRPCGSRRLAPRSKPTHTEALRVGVNPVNQASLKSSVVPVLPAAGS
jgi:hypothetical protein